MNGQYRDNLYLTDFYNEVLSVDHFQQEHPTYQVIKTWKKQFPNLTAGITTRHGGTSSHPYESLNLAFHVNDNPQDVINNRKILANQLGFSLDHWILGEQVHGANVETVKSDSAYVGAGSTPDIPAIANVDGIITNKRNVLLCAFFADCVPLYFYDPSSGWIGIAHAGWKGTVSGIAKEMVKRLNQEGVLSNRIHVAIGPSIGPQHYQVNHLVIDQIPQQYIEHVCVKLDHVEDQYLLDLKKLNYLMLIDQDIRPEQITISQQCTFEQDYFYSHRRDQGKTGRMLGFIGLS